MSQQNRLDIDLAKERVKEFLQQYLIAMGVDVNSRGGFRCINPDHDDRSPSAGIVNATDGKLFHCFSCHCAGSIFEAASMLEGKPLSGPGFLSDNLRYLANRFGIDVPVEDLTSDERYEMEIYTAYSHAAMVIKNSSLSERVKAKITDYGWEAGCLLKLGVGSISSYEDYISRMTKQYGHKLEFLQEVDLANKALFSPDNLIFTIKDDHSSPVGFSARNLRYEEQKADYAKKRDEMVSLHGEDSEKVKALPLPKKFINSTQETDTGVKNRIYQKSKRLFNFDLAKKMTGSPLYLVEGNSDVTTMFCGGIRNVAGICSTAFTKEHLDLILSYKIRHLIFVLDADKAGEDGTRRFVKLVEETTGGHVGLRVEIITMPEGTDDPDSYIRKFGTLAKGAEQFRKLERIDVFSWRLKEALKVGEDPESLAEKTIPLIVNEKNYLRRGHMTEQLSKQTGLDQGMLWREVLRQVDYDAQHIAEEKASIARRTATELLRNRDIEVVLEGARAQVEQVEKNRIGYTPNNVVAAIELANFKAMQNVNRRDLLMDWPVLENAINGIPTEECFISLPGKPNQGKSTFLDNIAYRLVDHNPDVMVLFHSVDDALSIRIARILGAKFNIRSEYFKRSGYWLQEMPNFEEKYNCAMNWFMEVTRDERLILTDASLLPGSLPSLENWVKHLRQKFPKRHLIVMGDNFHLYDLPGHDPGEDKVRHMSMFIKRMTTQQRCTALFTAELPKESLRPGVRPRIGKIKGTSGVAYDVSANFGVYNDLKDMAENAKIYWSDSTDMRESQSPDGITCYTAMRKPVIEVVIDKSKLSDFDGVVYFRLSPETGHMEECSAQEQELFRTRMLEGGSSVDLATSSAPYRSMAA